MDSNLRIVLPWPDKNLNPNRKTHWAVKAKASKKARKNAYFITLNEKGLPLRKDDNRLDLFITFYPPDKRRRDRDNTLASLKPYLDGIADAWKIDDYYFNIIYQGFSEPVKGGQVIIEVVKSLRY